MTQSRNKGQVAANDTRSLFEPIPFGSYYLIDRISRGGMSDIYLAKTVGPNGFQKPVVIKKLLPQYATQSRFLKRFINEAKTLARLNHGNIVQVFDLGTINDEPYIALEYIEGRNVAYALSKAMRAGRPPSLAFALHIVIEVAKGLAYAHRRGGPTGANLMLVHQDINTFNVMISFEAEVKIIDFGIARIFLDRDAIEELPMAGKLLYFSPEQLQNKPTDRRVDVYGTGILLYELLTGQRLIEHQESVPSTVRAILELNRQDKVTSHELIPKELHPIVLKAIAFDPQQRYSWLEDMLDDLRGVIKTMGLDVHTPLFVKYMKTEFHREILLDRRRMRKLWAEDMSSRERIQPRSAIGRGLWGRQDVNLADLLLAPFRVDTRYGDADEEATQSGPRVISFPAGQTVYKQGDDATDVYVIRSGKVRTFLEVGQKRKTLALLKSGDIFGETALLGDPCRTETALALEITEVVCLDRETFANLVGPELARKIFVSLLVRLKDSLVLLESVLFEDTLSRLIHGLIYFHRRFGLQNGQTVDLLDLQNLFGLAEDENFQKYLDKLQSLEALEPVAGAVAVLRPEKLESILGLLSQSGKLTLKL